MKVRTAGERDATTLLALRLALWPQREVAEHERAIQARAAGRARHETLVAEDAAGQVVGFAELTFEPAGPERPAQVRLDALNVAPPARRQGVARELMRAAERWAHGRGAARIACDLDPDDERRREALGWLGFGDPRPRLTLSRTVNAPLELPREPAGAPAEEPPIVMRPARSPALLVLNLALLAAAVASFAFTDIYARDVVRGVLLPLLDVAFVVYFLFLFVVLRYRRRVDAASRADRLFRGDG